MGYLINNMKAINPNTFIQQWTDAIEGLEAEMLQLDTRYKALPIWDSLILLLTVAMVESDYGVTLRGVDFEKAETVADLLELIRQRMQSA
jgi:acyl carrier protein